VAPQDVKTVLTDIKNGSREDYDTVELLFQEIDSHGRSRSSSCSESSQSSSTSHSLTSEIVRSTFREAPETDPSGRFRSPSRSTSESHKNMKNAPFHNGVIPSGRPAIKDYSPDVRRRLSDTVLIYENWVLANDGFPDKDMQYKWARKAWDMTSMDASEQFKLSERIIKLVILFYFQKKKRFTSAFANFIRSRLEDLAFVVVSRTSSGHSFQVITILAQVQARHPFPQISTDIIIS
jgi:hypothetical protein